MSIIFDAEDMLALLKIEAGKAASEYKKGEIGSMRDHLDRAQELILEVQNNVKQPVSQA